MIDNNTTKTLNFSMIATETKQIPLPTEKTTKRGFISWGDDNLYSYYLYDLYTHSSLFQGIVDMMVNYTLGDEIVNNTGMVIVNRQYMNFDEFIYKIVKDRMIYGGCAFQIIRNKLGGIAELNALDFKRVRVNEDEDTVYYMKDWKRTRDLAKTYPRYVPNTKQPVSVFYYKGKDSDGVYPTPMYQGAITSLEIHSQISQYHLTNILNNFTPSVIVNFNNGGGLSDDVMDEIEQKMYEKFSGTDKAGRIMLSFNDDTEHSTTVERLSDDGLDTKYQQLYDTTINDIFTAFKCNPILLGKNNTNGGFNKQEFSESFTLYQKTVIKPIQREIVDIMEKVFGAGCVEIEQFSIDWGEDVTNPTDNNSETID